MLEDAYEENSVEHIFQRMASVFARWCAVVEILIGFDVVKRLSSKYSAKCAYCGYRPCQCPRENRQEPKFALADESQLLWSLKQWQDHFFSLYGEKNKARGIDFALRRLFSEDSEVMSVWLWASVNGTRLSSLNATDYQDKLTSELCDVFAWICGLANLFELDLQSAVSIQYNKGCRTCTKFPCVCQPFVYIGGDKKGV